MYRGSPGRPGTFAYPSDATSDSVVVVAFADGTRRREPEPVTSPPAATAPAAPQPAALRNSLRLVPLVGSRIVPPCSAMASLGVVGTFEKMEKHTSELPTT